MSCEAFQAALVDAAVARPEGFEGHLACCAECRELAEALNRAASLRGAMPVEWRVPRGRVVRRAAALALVLVAGGFAAARLGSRHAPSKPPPVREWAGPGVEYPPQRVAPAVVGDEDVAAQWLALVALKDFVALQTQRDLRTGDATYASFGALPLWVAPSRTQPMRTLGRAASPLVYTSED